MKRRHPNTPQQQKSHVEPTHMLCRAREMLTYCKSTQCPLRRLRIAPPSGQQLCVCGDPAAAIPITLCLAHMSSVTRVIESVGPHRFAGRVVQGFQRGSKQLGWPTANLDPAAFESKLDAATEGVYVGWASIGDPTLPEEARAVHKAILSIGWNPQFDDVKERTCEAYLVHDFAGTDFYDAPMKLLICAFLRPQAKFEAFQDLIDAITADVEFGKAALDTPELTALRADAFFDEVSEATAAEVKD